MTVNVQKIEALSDRLGSAIDGGVFAPPYGDPNIAAKARDVRAHLEHLLAYPDGDHHEQ